MGSRVASLTRLATRRVGGAHAFHRRGIPRGGGGGVRPDYKTDQCKPEAMRSAVDLPECIFIRYAKQGGP